jgi:hypothetical protein
MESSRAGRAPKGSKSTGMAPSSMQSNIALRKGWSPGGIAQNQALRVSWAMWTCGAKGQKEAAGIGEVGTGAEAKCCGAAWGWCFWADRGAV